MQKPKSRAIDKDQTLDQGSLAKKFAYSNKMSDILRLEVRLHKVQKVKAVLKRLGFQDLTTFEQIFKKDVCQKLIIFYWHTLVKSSANRPMLMIESTSVNMTNLILTKFPKMKPKQLIYCVGLISLVKAEDGAKNLRNIIERSSDTRTWYRTKKYLETIANWVSSIPVRSWVQTVDDALSKFIKFQSNINNVEKSESKWY